MKTLTSMKMVEGDIKGFLLSIVGVAVVLAVGLIVLTNMQITAGNTGGYVCKGTLHTILNGTRCRNTTTGGYAGHSDATLVTTTAGNATGSVLAQMATIPQWIGIVITVALAFIVLGYFYNRM